MATGEQGSTVHRVSSEHRGFGQMTRAGPFTYFILASSGNPIFGETIPGIMGVQRCRRS